MSVPDIPRFDIDSAITDEKLILFGPATLVKIITLCEEVFWGLGTDEFGMSLERGGLFQCPVTNLRTMFT